MAPINVVAARMGSDDYHRAARLLGGVRRPEDVSLFRSFMSASYCTSIEEMRGRWRGLDFASDQRKLVAQMEVNRDIFARETLKHSDTVMFYGGPEFCDLIAATDMPPVVDLSALERIGNHTLMILFQRNIPVSNSADAIVAVMVSIADPKAEDNLRRIIGSMIHADESTSSFQYKFTEEHPGLGTVHWQAGFNSRSTSDDVSNEQRILSNVLGLLAVQSLTQVTPWRHYTKADKTAAAKGKRRLPVVNVITLQRRAQKDLDEFHESRNMEREGWWPQRGHFRLQPCGPNRKQRRLTYIRPCVKGNLAGPNIGRVQVHQTI